MSTIDPGKLMYYNPTLITQSNLLTPYQILLWAASNDITNLLYDDSSISRFFDATVFISDFKEHLDVSTLNIVIRDAMLKEGFTMDMLNARAEIAPSIYQDARVIRRNVLAFNVVPVGASNVLYSISPQSMQRGDMLQIRHNVTYVNEYVTVANIYDAQTFEVYTPTRVLSEIGEAYTVIGIQVYDIERIARINSLAHARFKPYVPPEVQVVLDPEFNPDLYRLLYPDMRNQGDLACYQDYVQRRDKEEYRIRNADDLGYGTKVNHLTYDSNALAFGDRDYTTVHSSMVVERHLAVNGEIAAKALRLEEFNITNLSEEVQNMHIEFELSMDNTASIVWRDVYVRGLSQDALRPASVLDRAEDNLVTEWAIKTYVDRAYLESATFNDMQVNGNCTITGGIYIHTSNAIADDMTLYKATIGDMLSTCNLLAIGNAVFAGQTSFVSPSSFCNDATFVAPIYVNGGMIVKNSVLSNVYIGHGTCMTLVSENHISSNVIGYNKLTSLASTELYGDVDVQGIVTFDKFKEHDTVSFNLPVNFYDQVTFMNDVVSDCNLIANMMTASNGIIALGSNYINDLLAENVSVTSNITCGGDVLVSGDIKSQSGSFIGSAFGIGGGLPPGNNSGDVFVRGKLVVGEPSASNPGVIATINGLLEATNFPVASDIRIKKDIETIDSLAAIAAVKQTSSVFFRYLNEAESDRRHLGFIADDVEAVMPEAVIHVPSYSFAFNAPVRVLGVNQLEVLVTGPVLQVGDALILEDNETYPITQVLSPGVYQTGRNIPLGTRLMLMAVINDFKTLDYTYMLSMLYAAVGRLIG